MVTSRSRRRHGDAATLKLRLLAGTPPWDTATPKLRLLADTPPWGAATPKLRRLAALLFGRLHCLLVPGDRLEGLEDIGEQFLDVSGQVLHV